FFNDFDDEPKRLRPLIPQRDHNSHPRTHGVRRHHTRDPNVAAHHRPSRRRLLLLKVVLRTRKNQLRDRRSGGSAAALWFGLGFVGPPVGPLRGTFFWR